jgi:Trk-type K+ transport system membrane component
MEKTGWSFHGKELPVCTFRARLSDFSKWTKRICSLASVWLAVVKIGQMDEGGETREIHVGLDECRKLIHPLLALVALGCLLVLVGWTGDVTGWEHPLTVGIGLVFALERAWSLKLAWPQKRERRRLVNRGGLALIVFGLSVALLFPGLWGSGMGPFAGHVLVQMAVLVSGIALMISHQTRFTARAFHPGLVLIGSFLFIVVTGALLLKMPRCTVPGQTCSWLDAFFTSTSAVCVTGLSVQNTALFFTTTGQTVILFLIQIGGLGIMTLTFFAAVVLFEGLSLHDRLLLGKMIQENRLARVGQTLKFIVVMTFVCEGLGAVILFFSLDGIPTLSARLFHAVFHSVSAFCNAGFSTHPDGLATDVIRGNWIWQIVVMSLIVIGGLGALVNEDLSFWSIAKIKRWLSKEGPRRRLRVHTRLVLVVNTLLIVGGAMLILVTEFYLRNGPENGGRILTAFFHSVTARTAGFNTVGMSQIGILTAQVLMVLMVIGGSPGGTAGGMRTTVAAVGLVHLWQQLRGGKRGMVFFNRTIPLETGSQALGLIFLTGIWLGVNFVILQYLQTGSGVSETSLLFELISAFATVGLSLDLTPTLTDGAKTLLIVNMFVGRVGLLTVMATLIKPDTRPSSGKPQEDILLT